MTFEKPSRLEMLEMLEMLEKESAQFFENWHKTRCEKEALEVKLDELQDKFDSMERAAKVILTWVGAEIGVLSTREKLDISNLLRPVLKI